MRKLLLLICALLTGVSGAWAALSSSTIAKSGNVTDTWNITSALSTDNWTAMGDATPTGVTALGSYTAYCRTQDITLSDEGALFITFLYSKGSDRLDILGVDLLNENNEVVRSDYHNGYTGTALSHNVYMLDHITSGDYKIRFIINSGVSNSVGNITVKHINIKTASSFENITNWYFVRMHSNQTNYMYYDKSERGIAFSSSKQNNAHYLWGFVKDTDGIKIYNKAAGSSVAIDNANPCALSASGQTFTFGTGSAGSNGAAAGAYFSLYKNPDESAAARSYLNYQSNIARWGSDDAGSAWMIDETDISAPFVSASEGKVYTIKAYFSSSSYTDLYFTNNDGTLAFNSSATNGVKDYWILRSSGNGTYPWKFESGRGDGKYLSPTTGGVTADGGWMQINNCTDITSPTCYHLRGSSSDKDVTSGNIRNLGTWSPDGSNKYSGFANSGPNTGCYGGGHVNAGYQWTTDYIIEEVTGVDIYTIVSNLNDGGVTKTTYTGKAEQTNGGFYILNTAPSVSDFTAISIENYTPTITVDATTKTITVNYTANFTYTLTDINGATYSWSASGSYGTAPTLTGCAGLTVSNEVWNEEARTYTANITFPFPVSSNSKTNWTYIGSFASLNRTAQWTWHVASAGATDINAQSNVLPTNEDGDIERWKWSIEPTFSNGNFTFKIKNSATPKYITMSASQHNHDQGSVTLETTGTPLIWDSGNAWKKSDGNYYLSVNSYQPNPSDLLQYLGQHGSTHYGTNVGYITPDDFSTLMANLKTARTTFNNYFLLWTQGKYSETVEGTMTTVYAQLQTDRYVVNNPPTAYFTAAQFKTYTDNYNTAVAGLRYVMPTFFRVKNLDGSKYVKERSTIDYANYYQLEFSADGTDAKSIFYLNASNSIISYYSGSYLFSINHTKPVSYNEATYQCTYEFLPGSDVNRVYVHVANNPSGWGGSEKYWIATDTKVGRGTAPTADSDFLIEAVTSLPVTITAAGWATAYFPVAVTIPKNVKAYTGTINNGYVHLEEIVGTIPANCAVVLSGDAGTYNFEVTTTDETAGNNDFKGEVATFVIPSSDTYYTLRADSDGSNPGFFTKEAGKNIQGFRAYLKVDGASQVRALMFHENTGVNIPVELIQSENTYDLQGRRVQTPDRGLYIINGKKVIF